NYHHDPQHRAICQRFGVGEPEAPIGWQIVESSRLSLEECLQRIAQNLEKNIALLRSPDVLAHLQAKERTQKRQATRGARGLEEEQERVRQKLARLKILKAEMAAAHPDHGGTSQAFMAARRRYVRARDSSPRTDH